MDEEHVIDSDLLDPTIRSQMFGGRAVEEIQKSMPIFPLSAWSMGKIPPVLGAMSLKMGDAAPVTKSKAKTIQIKTPGAHLNALVRSLLYEDSLFVSVPTPGGDISVPYLPGKLYGAPTKGPRPATLMIVTKAVGPVEDQQRELLVGPLSEPFWQAWREVGLPDPTGWVYVTSVLRFFPPASAGKTTPAAWMADGKYLIQQEIRLVKPTWILALGADAVKAVCAKDSKLDQYQGVVAERDVDTRISPDDVSSFPVKITATLSPGQVAYEPNDYPLLRAGLSFFARHAAKDIPVTGEQVIAPASEQFDFKAIYTLKDLEAEAAVSAAQAANGGYLAFDLEWQGRHPIDPGSFLYTVQWSHGPNHARCVYIHRCGGVVNEELPKVETFAVLSALLGGAAARGTRLVGHFSKGDLVWLRYHGVDLFPYYTSPGDDPDPDGRTRLFGYQKTYAEGGFDTYLGMHAVEETARFKLEVICNTLFGIDRWDTAKDAETARVLAERGLKPSDLGGYGFHSEDVITPYGCMDAAMTGRLYLYLNGDPRTGSRGALDHDRFGNSSREIFHLRMQSFRAWGEMEDEGLLVDVDEINKFRDTFTGSLGKNLEELRKEVAWPEFAPSKPAHRIELLYGESYHGKPRVRPPGALSLGLSPYNTTPASGGKLWDDAMQRFQDGTGPKPTPSTDKEAVAAARRDHPVANLFFRINILRTALSTILRPPDPPKVDKPTKAKKAPVVAESVDEAFTADDADEGGAPHPDAMPDVPGVVYSRGLMRYVSKGDGRVRSMFGMTETGRGTSSGPNVQNQGGENADDRYKLSVGGDINKIRTIFKARPGWVIVCADLQLAEVAVAGWNSNDKLLMEHAKRGTLPKSDPDSLDLHADLAVRSFRLDCAPTKAALKAIGKGHLRTAAKRTRFGHYYGASAGTLLRKILEEPDAADVTVEDVQAIIEGHDREYPELAKFFASVRECVSTRGWIKGPFGAYRRFRTVNDRQVAAEQEREGQNATCQNPVADAVNRWLARIYDARDAMKLKFRIILSVHDSVMVEAPIAEAEIAAEIIKYTITKEVPFVPCLLDGTPIRDRGPYFFGADVSVGPRWEDWLDDNEWVKDSRLARGLTI